MLEIKRERLVGKPIEEVSLEDITRLGDRLGEYFGGEKTLFVSGRDFYPASRMFKRALTAGLMSRGVEILDFHESINGEIAFSIKRFGARGGFSIIQDPYDPEKIMVRVFKNPGVEVVGGEIRRLLSREEGATPAERRVGWVNYAEYIHKLYISALTSFVKTDAIIERGVSIIVGSSRGALDIILPDLITSLRLDSIIFSTRKMIEEKAGYPLIDEISKTSRIVNALDVELGVVFNNDASSLTIYTKKTGLLMPEEVALTILTRYRQGSKILVDKWWSERYLEEVSAGYNVIKSDSEEEMFLKLKKEKPVIAVNGRGEIVIPLFSLGYDGLLGFAAFLEAVSLDQANTLSRVRELRERLFDTNGECLEMGDIKKMCFEARENCVNFAGGFKVREGGSVHTYLYEPVRNCFKHIV
ncbi:MAG: phosphoglucomutase [Thermosphaera sp.]